MSTTESILVLGTGELGTEVLQALATHSQRGSKAITVLLRPNSATGASSKRLNQLAEFQNLGISTVYADIVNDTHEMLREVFDGYHTIIGCTGMTHPPGTQLKLARAVLDSQARRYLPWQFGLDYDIIGRGSSQNLFGEQLDVRDLLRGQTAVSWVIISTGLFMSFLFEPAFGVVDANRTTVTALGSWENKVTVTTAQDIGRVVAEVVFSNPGLHGVIFTAGTTATYQGVADAVEKVQRVNGVTVRREEATVDQLKHELELDPENGMKKYRVVFAEGKGVGWDEAVTFNQQRGLKMTGIDEYLASSL